MANRTIKAWQEAHNVSDGEIMMVLGLKSAEQFRNRMSGRTKWTALERKTLADYACMTEEELFERG